MTDKEKIIAEIERLMNWKPKAIPSGMRQRDVLNIRKGVLLTLKAFINSLSAEQQPSEDLGIDEELKRFFEINNLFVDANDLQTVRHCNGSPVDKRYYFEDIARHFAQWQKEQTIKKACEWLNKNVVEYHPRKGELRPIVNINAFREAMGKEDEPNRVNIEPPSFEESQGEFNSYNVALNG